MKLFKLYIYVDDDSGEVQRIYFADPFPKESETFQIDVIQDTIMKLNRKAVRILKEWHKALNG